MIVLANKVKGFTTMATLLFLTLTSIIVGDSIKKEKKQTIDYYGKNMSLNEEHRLLAKKIFYFDHDSYKIKSQDKIYIFAHARNLLKNPRLNLLIVGHTNSRGIVGYNFKLGILRSTAIADLLISKGVDRNRIITISYADQIPIKDGYNIEDVVDYNKLNRRVEIKYINIM